MRPESAPNGPLAGTATLIAVIIALAVAIAVIVLIGGYRGRGKPSG